MQMATREYALYIESLLQEIARKKLFILGMSF